MKPLPLSHQGEYLNSAFRQKPPAALAEDMGIPLPELLQQMEPEKTSEGLAS